MLKFTNISGEFVSFYWDCILLLGRSERKVVSKLNWLERFKKMMTV